MNIHIQLIFFDYRFLFKRKHSYAGLTSPPFATVNVRPPPRSWINVIYTTDNFTDHELLLNKLKALFLSFFLFLSLVQITDRENKHQSRHCVNDGVGWDVLKNKRGGVPEALEERKQNNTAKQCIIRLVSASVSEHTTGVSPGLWHISVSFIELLYIFYIYL